MCCDQWRLSSCRPLKSVKGVWSSFAEGCLVVGCWRLFGRRLPLLDWSLSICFNQQILGFFAWFINPIFNYCFTRLIKKAAKATRPGRYSPTRLPNSSPKLLRVFSSMWYICKPLKLVVFMYRWLILGVQIRSHKLFTTGWNFTIFKIIYTFIY